MLTSGMLVVDNANSNKGIIKVRISGTSTRRLKLQIDKRGSERDVWTYDLNGKGTFETFPLQEGSGIYKVTLYQNTEGKLYRNIAQVIMNIYIPDENSVYLQSNQYVNYENCEAVIKLAKEYPTITAIKNLLRDKYYYDFIKACTVAKQSTLPDIPSIIQKKRGICQDLAALAVALMRLNNIPAKLVIGKADGSYHAWVNCYINGAWKLYDPTQPKMGRKAISKYTAERWY